METEAAMRHEYASAIGLVILAFGDLDAEMLSFAERLGTKLSRRTLEEASFTNRTKEIERLALLRGVVLLERIETVCARARELSDQRDSCAHGHFWRDLDGSHRLRSFLRRPGLKHDDRTPQQIVEISFAIDRLRDDVAVLATSIPSPRDPDAERDLSKSR